MEPEVTRVTHLGMLMEPQGSSRAREEGRDNKALLNVTFGT